MRSFLFILVAFSLVLFSCDNTDRVSVPTLINAWTEIEPDLLQYVGSNYSSLHIYDDSSFQLKFREWGDLIYQNDPCGYVYDYYAKGTCSTSGSEIFFTGCFTDSTYNVCIANCAGILDYNRHYQYALTMDSLILNPGHEWTSRRDMVPE